MAPILRWFCIEARTSSSSPGTTTRSGVGLFAGSSVAANVTPLRNWASPPPGPETRTVNKSRCSGVAYVPPCVFRLDHCVEDRQCVERRRAVDSCYVNLHDRFCPEVVRLDTCGHPVEQRNLGLWKTGAAAQLAIVGQFCPHSSCLRCGVFVPWARARGLVDALVPLVAIHCGRTIALQLYSAQGQRLRDQ